MGDSIHKLLLRQIRRHFGSIDQLPDGLRYLCKCLREICLVCFFFLFDFLLFDLLIGNFD